jgi:hypothetical protein
MLPTQFPGQGNLAGFHSIDALLGIREEMRENYMCPDSGFRNLPENARLQGTAVSGGKYYVMLMLSL